MRRKIFLYYIILVIIGISITSFFTTRIAQKFYKQEVEEKLESIALLIQSDISEKHSKGNLIDYDFLANKYSEALGHIQQTTPSVKRTGIRVTFIDFKGNVLGESETDYHSMENHLTRKEVQEALQGKIGHDVRFSNILKLDFLYTAVPINSAGVIARVSVPLTQLNRIEEIMLLYTVFFTLLGIMLTSLLAYRFSSSITNPLEELISMSRELAVGNYSKRV